MTPDVGWAALERGAWDEAHEAFTAQLADAERANLLEGLAWAAWWRNQPDTVFRARERAFQLYRAQGDAAAAARMAIWLGCDYYDFRGEPAIASGWHRRARRLLREVPIGAEHGWLAFQQGAYALELEDDTATARHLAAEAANIAHTLGSADLEFLALALEGLALVTEGQVAEGMARLDEAGIAATSGEISDRLASAWTLCYLIYACERARDFERTAQWCRRMQDVSTRFAFELGLGVCRAHYGGVLLLHGEWDAAEQELQEASKTLARTRPPAVAESLVRLGELRRRQGRIREATDFFDRSAPHPLARLGQASIALDAGDVTRAFELARDLLDSIPNSSRTQRADPLELSARALAARGDIERAGEAAATVSGIAAAIGTAPLHGLAAQAEGLVALAAEDATSARRRLERALELFARAGLPFEAGCARTELARALFALGSVDAARQQASQAAHDLGAIGAVAAAQRATRLVQPSHATVRVGPAAGIAGLTRREAEVLDLVAAGMTDREIGERLGISPHTVHRHVSNILRKLQLPGRTAAAAFAARHGLTPPPPV